MKKQLSNTCYYFWLSGQISCAVEKFPEVLEKFPEVLENFPEVLENFPDNKNFFVYGKPLKIFYIVRKIIFPLSGKLSRHYEFIISWKTAFNHTLRF